MGQRKIFTKREYEKLSKTHEGRQKINTTYLGCAIFGIIASAVIFFVFLYLFIDFEDFGISSELFILICLMPAFCLILSVCFAVYYYSAYREENRQEEIRQKIESERIQRLKDSSISEIDNMNGFEFEEFISHILSDLGYNVKTTRKSGDFGADLILEKNGEKTIVQTKRYSQKVSVSAIQEIAAAQNFYRIYNACVITNNYFTSPAIKLANANDIKLIDRDELSKLIIESKELHNQRIQGNFPNYLVGRDR